MVLHFHIGTIGTEFAMPFCRDTLSHTKEVIMEKRHLERFAEITEKLATASDREAYRILTKCEALIEKAKIDLVKKDFSLSLTEAIFQISCILPQHGGRCNDLTGGVYESCWYHSKCPEEHLSLHLDCQKLNDVIISIVVWRKTDERTMIQWDNLIEPPKGLAEIIASLDGFSEKKTGMWSKSLGAVKSLAQAKRIILPAWEETYNAIKPFGDKW